MKFSSYSSILALAFSVSYFSSKQTALIGNLGIADESLSWFPINNPLIGIKYLDDFNSIIISRDLSYTAQI